MKYLIITVLFFGTRFAMAQTTPGEVVAVKIADKMRDSLGLSGTLRDSIYQINMQLHTQKMDARGRITGEADLKNAIQQIENTRDSLYRQVLTDDKYLLYRQKKIKLVSAL